LIEVHLEVDRARHLTAHHDKRLLRPRPSAPRPARAMFQLEFHVGRRRARRRSAGR
jgi:hypothetical protein